jgi:hypothetical protein
LNGKKFLIATDSAERGVASDKEFLASDLVRGREEKTCAEVVRRKCTQVTRKIKAESVDT